MSFQNSKLLNVLNCVLSGIIILSVSSAMAHNEHDHGPGFTHLKFAAGTIHAHANWEQGPRTPDESILKLEWKNGKDHSPLDLPGTFEVKIFMPDMGHGSAPVHIEKISVANGKPETGAYRVSQIFFPMAGHWQVKVILHLASKPDETQIIDVNLGKDEKAPAQKIKGALNTPALRAICADGVTAHPTRPGFWHIDRPRFARSANTLFATMDLRPNELGEYAIVRIDQSKADVLQEVARFRNSIRGIAFHSGVLWALFSDRVVSLDPSTGQIIRETRTLNDIGSNDDDSAQAFAWVGSELLIAHGTRGVVVYDPTVDSMVVSSSLGLNEGGRISKAIDVAAVGEDQALFAVEGVTLTKEPPFTFSGMILLAANGQFERFAYNRASEGVLAHARISVLGDQVVVNNWGILQTASLSTMRASHSVNFRWVPVHFEVNSTTQPGELLGDVLLDNDGMTACAQTEYQDPITHKVIHRGVLYSN